MSTEAYTSSIAHTDAVQLRRRRRRDDDNGLARAAFASSARSRQLGPAQLSSIDDTE